MKRRSVHLLSLPAVGALLGLLALAIAVSVVLLSHGGSHTRAVAAAPAATSTASTGPAASNQAASGVYLGVRVSEQNGQLTVQSVDSGGPADKAGVKQGDVITAVDGTTVHTTQDLAGALNGKKGGDTVALSVQRNGASQQIQVTLESRPARGSAQNAAHGFLGVTVQNATSADQQQYKLTTTNGALVTSVQQGGPAASARIKQGDLITAVNGTAVNNVSDLTNALKNTKPGDSVTVQYQRAGSSQSATIRLGTAPAGGGRGLPGFGGIGAVLGGNFDRFISTETKTRDANGTVHTDTTIGAVVRNASSTQVTVTPNGGGSDQTFNIDANTRIRGVRPGSGNANGSTGSGQQLQQGDKVLITTRDGSQTASSIFVVPAIFGAGNKHANTQDGNSGGQNDTDNGNRGRFEVGPNGSGGFRIQFPGGGQITLPGGNSGGIH